MKKILLFMLLTILHNLNCQFNITTTSFAACYTFNDCNRQFINSLSEATFTKFGSLIPAKFTCDGVNISPELSWNDVPAGTQSFVLIVDDPDAIKVVGKTFIHWFAMNIPMSITSFVENQSFTSGEFQNIVQLPNDFGAAKYSGPCPPVNDPVHHYYFTIFALNVSNIGLSKALTAEQFKAQFKNNIIGCTSLVGLYRRPV